jgi:putative hydrolase of the HAD superfamily
MGAFIRDLLGVDATEARRVQKDYFARYGLTVKGLMAHHGVAAEEFLDYVHDVDLSDIRPDPALAEALAALPGRRIIHTNSDAGHTHRVLKRLGIDPALFDTIHDIATTRYEPKPAPVAYDHVLEAEGADPARAAMFEDAARNLLEPHRRGMRTVHLPTSCDIASAGGDAEHVHFSTNDLSGFLKRILEDIA